MLTTVCSHFDIDEPVSGSVSLCTSAPAVAGLDLLNRLARRSSRILPLPLPFASSKEPGEDDDSGEGEAKLDPFDRLEDVFGDEEVVLRRFGLSDVPWPLRLGMAMECDIVWADAVRQYRVVGQYSALAC